MRFSRRIDWSHGENPISRAVKARKAAGQPYIDATVSNPSAAALCASADTLAQALASPALASYRPEPLGPAPARAAIAAHLAVAGTPVDADDIIITSSTSEAYAWLFKLLADAGEEVAVPAPSYPLFEYLASLESLRTRPYRLCFPGDGAIDFATLTTTAAAVVVVSPNNPTGSYLRTGDLERLARHCAANQQALICDEVFRDYPVRPRADAVSSVLGRPLECLGVALGGLSKSCGLPQLKLGWMVLAGPAAARSAARARLELICDTYLSVNTPVLLALPRLLELGADLRARIHARIMRNHAVLQDQLAGSAATAFPVEGGWSAVVRVPAVRSDEGWVLQLLADDGVLVQPGYFYDLENGDTRSYLVLSLLTEESAFALAAAALREAVSRA